MLNENNTIKSAARKESGTTEHGRFTAMPTIHDSTQTSTIILRDDQEEALVSIKDALADGVKKQIINCPCGWGKTIVLSEVARRTNTNTLILVYNNELLGQTIEKLRLVWPSVDVGIVGGGSKDFGHQVTVSTVQSAYRDATLRQLLDTKLLIIDECHHAAGDTTLKIIDSMKLDLLCGFTATAFRSDRKGLKEIFDKIVFARNYPWAVDRGLLCMPRGIKMGVVNTAQLKTSNGDYTEESLKNAVITPRVTSEIINACKQHVVGRKCILFAINIAHAEMLSEKLSGVGFKTDIVHSLLAEEERSKAIAKLRDGTIDILCNVGVLLEGFDCPAVDCAIMARPTKSRGLYLQATGRALRLYPGKVDALILDCSDTGHTLCNAAMLTHDKPKGKAPADAKPGGKKKVVTPLSNTVKVLLADFDPLGRCFKWFRADVRLWKLCSSEICLIVKAAKDGNGWGAVLMTAAGSVREVLLWPPHSFDVAFNVAEEWARRHRSQFALHDYKAPWQQQTITPSQLKFLAAFGYKKADGTETLTRGQAAHMISKIRHEIQIGGRRKPYWYKS